MEKKLEDFIWSMSKKQRVRTYHALLYNNIETMDQLIDLAKNKQSKILKFQNFGRKGLDEILDRLGIESETTKAQIKSLESKGYEVRKIKP